MLSGLAIAAEGARPNVNFNHDQTKFSLSGVHTNTACESCHVKGIFKGTPTTCSGCHAQGGTAISTIAATKPSNHIPTTEDCGACHKTDSFTTAVWNHTKVTQTCATCHNGRIETGKPVTHILTTQDCGVCHKTSAWTPAGYDHAGLTIGMHGCTNCHNGSTASSKPARHILTTQQCDVCHQTFNAWLPAGYTHAATDTDCLGCHNGTNATGKTTNHIRTAQQCNVCHSQSAWLPAYFVHGPSDTNCVSCHNGTDATRETTRHIPRTAYPAATATAAICDACHTQAGWRPTFFRHTGVTTGTCSNCHVGGYTAATVKPASHLPTGSYNCDACHQSTSDWLPTNFDHTGASGTCTSCHDKTHATGRPATHTQLSLASGQCDVCHTTSAWTPTPMNHSGQTACSTCHTYAGNTWTAAYSGHINTGSRQCSDCHTTINWSGPVFGHQGISTASDCATSCHDGTHATGRPTAGVSAHTVAPMTNGTCGHCHAIGTAAGQTFKSPTPRMDHNGATSCSSCHSYSVAKWSMPGSPTLSSHITTTAQCSSCHLTTSAWSGARVDHASMNAATDCYTGCHDGVHGTGKPVSGSIAHMTAPMTNNTCGTCHAGKGVSWVQPSPLTAATMNNHSGATSCSSCHSYTTNASNWTTGSPKAGHIATGSQCSVCHTNFNSFANAVIDHATFAQGGDCRTNCHDGSHATGAPSSGISSHTVAPMSNGTCGNCHAKAVGTSHTGQSFTSTAPTMNSHIGATACANCHSYTVSKWSGPSPIYPSHIAITQQCSGCHSTSQWRLAAFNHAGITTASDCFTGCHDGTHATGRPSGGVSAHTVSPMTANTCGSCHAIDTSGTTSFRTAPAMNHTGATACSSCHSYSVQKWSMPGSPIYGSHLATTAQCDSCHVNTGSKTLASQWAGVAAVDHANFSPAVTSQSATCTGAGCHNGTNATGRPTSGVSAHTVAPMTADTCGNCHTIGNSTGQTFASPAPTMNSHTGATACSSCHSYTSAKWSGPSPVYSTHILTGAQCDSCHTSGLTGSKTQATEWSGVSYHTVVASPPADCYTGCHDGAHLPALGKTNKHVYAPMTSSGCGSCHTSYASFATWTMSHTGALVCSNCHSYTSQGNGWTTKNGSPTTIPVPGHPTTSAQCSTCHTTTPGWAASIDHSTMTAATDCRTGCHAPGGSASTSIPTSGTSNHLGTMISPNCGTCHTGKGVSWTSPLSLPTSMNNHNGVGTCATCHSYTTAKWSRPGSPTYVGHIATGASDCASCHQSFTSWASNVRFDHAANGKTSGDCTSGGCHAVGGNATSMPTSGSSAHILTMNSSSCGNCHQPGDAGKTFRNPTPTMNGHAGTAGSCNSCHSYSVAKWTNPGSPTYSSHLSTTAQCSTCHSTFTTWTAVAVNHASFSPAVTSQAQTCTGAGCHNGTDATGAPGGSSVSAHTTAPMTNGTCGNCHAIGNTAGITFRSPAPTMNSHSAATNCTACHSYATAKWSMPGSPTKTDHIPTGSYPQCSTCHSTGAWKPAFFSHPAPLAACSTCHNGAAATGPTAAHTGISPGLYACDACHKTSGWVPATFSHGSIASGCSNCHKSGLATAKSAAHFVTTQACEKCHKTGTAMTDWLVLKSYVHVTPAYKSHPSLSMTVYADCKACHITNNEAINAAPSGGNLAYKPDCAWCHTTKYKQSKHKQYSAPTTVYYTVDQLKNCSGACHTTNQTTGAVTTRNGPQHKTSGW